MAVHVVRLAWSETAEQQKAPGGLLLPGASDLNERMIGER